MANPVRLDTAHPPALSMRHTVGIEPVTAELRRLDPSVPAGAVLAVVERTGGRFGKVCTTDLHAAKQGTGDLESCARGYAHAYGAHFVPAAPEVAHPAIVAADQMPAPLVPLVERAECVYDPELHTGPDSAAGVETGQERAAREQVAREVCEGCPVRTLCLAYALAIRPAAGVWATFTAEQIATLAVRLPELAEVA
ncbi:WhiB family transcriptional regulator [Sphaerisporangium rhizosphaerae]|uniref:WhiB family transcriptional regulator n=1 Tax=Sphaerisporangium rhizosphaerae TaxID=2269375 RepID=A0ABW2P092_9ACTN